MRHTGVTDMLEDGISSTAIKAYAGWTSLRMLERYGHLRDAELQRATTGTAARNTAALTAATREGAHTGGTWRRRRGPSDDVNTESRPGVRGAASGRPSWPGAGRRAPRARVRRRRASARTRR